MIDHHVHLGTDCRTSFSLDIKTLSKRLDSFGIEKAIVFACPNQKREINPYKEFNGNILEASRQDNRVLPFMFIHPLLDELSYIEKNQEKFSGFKLYPRAVDMEYHYGFISSSRILDLIVESSKPIIVHTGFRIGNRIKDLSWLLERKKSPVVFVHSGDLMDEDLRDSSRYENSFVDVSPLITMIEKDFFVGAERRDKKLKELSPDKILNYLKSLYGKERIIGGTDSPWSDNLIENGYEREINVLRRMEECGFPNKLPLRE